MAYNSLVVKTHIVGPLAHSERQMDAHYRHVLCWRLVRVTCKYYSPVIGYIYQICAVLFANHLTLSTASRFPHLNPTGILKSGLNLSHAHCSTIHVKTVDLSWIAFSGAICGRLYCYVGLCIERGNTKPFRFQCKTTNTEEGEKREMIKSYLFHSKWLNMQIMQSFFFRVDTSSRIVQKGNHSN